MRFLECFRPENYVKIERTGSRAELHLDDDIPDVESNMELKMKRTEFRICIT